jgi:hypothetical protein
MISGGSLLADAAAVGQGPAIPRGEKTGLEQSDPGQVALRLRQLSAAVLAQRSSITGYAEVSAAISLLASELEQRRPRRTHVLQLLGLIAQKAGSASSVASAVEALRTAVLAVA